MNIFSPRGALTQQAQTGATQPPDVAGAQRPADGSADPAATTIASGAANAPQPNQSAAEVMPAPWTTAPPMPPPLGFWALALSHLGRILVSKTMTFVLAALALVVSVST